MSLTGSQSSGRDRHLSHKHPSIQGTVFNRPDEILEVPWGSFFKEGLFELRSGGELESREKYGMGRVTQGQGTACVKTTSQSI